MTLRGARVLVAGLGRAGYASADGLLEVGADVRVVDERDSDALREKATILETLGASVRLGAAAGALPDDVQSLVVSSAWPEASGLVDQAVARGCLVWSDLEVAWRVAEERAGDGPGRPVWLMVAGEHAATVATLLGNILHAAEVTTDVVGRTRPVMEAVLDELAYGALVVEASPAQLRWTSAVSPHSAAVAGLPAPPGCLDDLARVYNHAQQFCVYDAEDRRAEQMVEDADVVEGARAIGYTTRVPAPSMVGVVDELIVDRAFIPQRADSAAELAKVADVAPDRLTDALVAAALARSFGVSSRTVGAALAGR